MSNFGPLSYQSFMIIIDRLKQLSQVFYYCLIESVFSTNFYLCNDTKNSLFSELYYSKDFNYDRFIYKYHKLAQSMRLKITILLLAILSFSSSMNFCEVQSSQVKLFITPNQTLQVGLDKYIRGFDLDFVSLNKSVVQIYQPYNVTETAQVTIKSGYSIVNVDGRNSDNHLWGREGIIFAQGGEKNVSVGYGKFASSVLPKVDGYNYYQLPYVSNCYSGLIYNQNLDVVIDCQKTTANPDDMTDLVCITYKSGSLKCKSFSSITKTSKRKSLIYTALQRKFLITATLTDHISSKFQNETFLTIYYVSDEGIQFNLLVDRRTLGLYSLSIADIDIVEIHSEQYILLTDVNSKLIAFKYTADNTVEDVKIFTVQGSPRQFAQSSQGTWLVANDKHVLDLSFNHQKGTLQATRKYELDPADNQVTDLQSSFLFVVVRTFFGHLYTYSRKYTQLKYLLNKQDISESTSVVVSPFYPRLFQINSTIMSSVSISSGHIYVSNVKQSTEVLVIGNSGTTSCAFSVVIQMIKDSTTKIYQKKTMTSSYRIQSNEQIKFILSDYFGGSNLKYQVQAPQRIDYRKQHINKYTQKLPAANEDETIFTKVIQIDSHNYYLAVFQTTQIIFYQCSLKGSETSCAEIDERVDISKEKRFTHADGLVRTDGSAYVAWCYAPGSNRVGYKRFGQKGSGNTQVGVTARYSQVLVAEVYFAYVQKQLGRMCFYDNHVLYGIQCFTKNDFTQAQLASMGGGFYPRQIFDSHNNPHVFYLKFPIAVVAISYTGGRNFEVLSYHPVSDVYIPDDLWSMVVGRETILLFASEKIIEYAILTDGSLRFLHQVQLNDRKPIFPVRYELSTDTAFFQCEDGTIQYIRLNQPALDSIFYNLQLVKSNNGVNWDVSGSWLVSTSGQVFYQFQQPAIFIRSNLPDSSFSDKQTISLIVSNQEQEKKVDTNVTAFNYPIKIDLTGAEDNGVTLPEKGDNQIISFPIDKYFKGPVADYRIVCSNCLNGTIQLLPPIRLIKQNQDLKDYDAIVGLEDGSGAIVIKRRQISIVDTNNNILSTIKIQNDGDCSSVGINDGNLVVFCIGSANQELFLYTLQNKILTLKKSYFIPGEALVFKASEIGVHKRNNVLTVFIHDADLMNPTARDSNIKVLELGDTIKFIGLIDASSFSQLYSAPINSMSISKDDLLVTIGGQGIGYLDLSDSKIKGTFVDLENEPSLQDFTLDNTAYLRVVINSRSIDKLTALVTTSNSYNYVFQFTIAQGKATFSKQLQIYKRYGHQKGLNWGLIDNSYVMLSFYNSTSYAETLAIYKRSTAGPVDFFSSVRYVIPAEALHPPKAALIHSGANSFLFRGTADKPAAEGSLSLYNVTHQFGLLLTYDKPSSMDKIQVIASNDYNSVSKELSVKFEGQDGGVKWYSIVIVVVLVAIAVGVAFGFYIRMKRKKADSKKVSLFTQNEEVDEQV